MIKLVYCIRRKAGLSSEDFQSYWLKKHGPLVKSLSRHTGACRYVQSHTFSSTAADGNNQARGSALEPYDGITELWWCDESDMQPAGSSVEDMIKTQKALLADEREFIDVEQSVVFFTQEHEIYCN